MKRQKDFTNEDLDKIKELFYQKVSVKKIGQMFDCSEPTMARLIKNKLKLNVWDRWKEDENLIERVIERLKTESLTKISKDLNFCVDTMSKRLKRRGIQIINRQNEPKFNQYVFDVIDTEEKAYWLGFIYADGFIDSSPLKNGQKSYYTFGLTLQILDIGHLDKFNAFMEHRKRNILTYTKDPIRPSCKWNIRNKHLWETLNSYGCTPKKSLTLEFPDESIFKSKDLIRHFIRGYFDGDGSLSYDTHKNAINPICTPRMAFIGTKMFLEKLEKYINLPCRWTHDKRHKDVTWSIWYNRKESTQLMCWLYDDSNIYLDRKYKRYLIFKKLNSCCSLKEFNELLSGKNGELWDENTVLSSEITKGSETM